MANLARVMNALYCHPWLISPAVHANLCEITRSHIDGTAHSENGRAEQWHAEKHGVLASGPAPEWWQNKWGEANGVQWVNDVVVFDIGGVIGRRFSSMLNNSGVTSVDVLGRMIEDAENDDRVSAMVFDFDTPGGTVSTVPEVGAKIAASKKPTVAYTGGLMASAGYWLASQADMIIAEPSAEIGSIGVYSAFLDRSRQFEMQGLKTELFNTGKYKGMGMPGISLTDEQRALIQSEVDTIFGWFVSAVTKSRRGVKSESMQGQTFFAEEAMRRGLIDKIGTINDAVSEASKMRR